MTTPWDNARRHARALETALDAKLSSYAKIAATVSRGAAAYGNRDELSLEEEGVGGYKLVEEEVEELLSKVSSEISMREHMDAETTWDHS